MRATLFLPQDSAPQSQEYMQRTVDSLKARGYDVYVEDGKEDITDRFSNPGADWYQDVAIKFTKNGVTRELLLLQENMWQAKMGMGHAIYESLRKLGAGALFQEERIKLNKRSAELYLSAFDADNPALLGGTLPSYPGRHAKCRAVTGIF